MLRKIEKFFRSFFSSVFLTATATTTAPCSCCVRVFSTLDAFCAHCGDLIRNSNFSFLRFAELRAQALIQPFFSLYGQHFTFFVLRRIASSLLWPGNMEINSLYSRSCVYIFHYNNLCRSSQGELSREAIKWKMKRQWHLILWIWATQTWVIPWGQFRIAHFTSSTVKCNAFGRVLNHFTCIYVHVDENEEAALAVLSQIFCAIHFWCLFHSLHRHCRRWFKSTAAAERAKKQTSPGLQFCSADGVLSLLSNQILLGGMKTAGFHIYFQKKTTPLELYDGEKSTAKLHNTGSNEAARLSISTFPVFLSLSHSMC